MDEQPQTSASQYEFFRKSRSECHPNNRQSDSRNDSPKILYIPI